ncbi:MAG: hypothetical protein IPJ81_15680 [Chitinophagaceae bacterium]|nr:hypothetical protein [Chitinophagaceae bacterium]
MKWAGMTSFNIYEYRANELWVSENRFYSDDSTFAKEEIYEFIKKYTRTDKLSPFRIVETAIDKNTSKLAFFRNYFLPI